MKNKFKFFIVIVFLSFIIVGCSDNSEEINNIKLEVSRLKDTIEIKDNEIYDLIAKNSEMEIIMNEVKPWLSLTINQQEIILDAIDDIDFKTEDSKNYSEASYSYNYVAGPLKLYSDDGNMVFLGEVSSDEFSSSGIFNEYGTHGSEYSTDSIWNNYGTYGSEYSSYSAFNSYATNPPVILDSGLNIVGRLTVNNYVLDAISPYDLKLFLKEHGL